MKYFLRGLVLIILICTATLVQAETKVYFSPNGGCSEAVISEIGKARKSIDIAMYAFTSRGIALGLLDAENRGVKIRIVLDNAQIKDHYSKGRFLLKKGIDVKYHLGPGLMHNKFAVIDGRVVLTGSFNWTISADKWNAENLLVIKDKAIAGKYQERFGRLWKESGNGSPVEDRPDEKM